MGIEVQQVIYTVLTILVAAAVGFFLRRLLVGRLHKTVLDDWLVETLGVILIILCLLLGGAVILSIWSINHLLLLWNSFTSNLTQDRLSGYIGEVWTIILSAFILVLGIGVGRTISKITIRNLAENRIDINTRTLLGRIFSFVILGIAIFWVLALWHLSIETPLAILGTLTVAFTFAIQDILKDLVAGFYILVERPFHIGDEISIESGATGTLTGRVEEVQLRATKVRLVSGEEVTIPNTRIFSTTVINNTFYGERRVTLTITLPQEQYDKTSTSKQILGILHEIDEIIPKPEPVAIISGYTREAVTLTIRFWIVHGQTGVIEEALHALRGAFAEAELAVKESAGAI
jgi:small-conductance mechanosensitive channel